MLEEVIVSSRPDRVIRKKLKNPGDFTIVPYEDSRCKIKITNLACTNHLGKCEIEPESKIFSTNFDGNVLIGDSDFFIDKDFELILQQMCSGETCEANMVYRDGSGELVKEISCDVELKEVTEEQLISDWSWERLMEASIHHKEKGVELVKEKRILDAFRRFSKALKMVVAIEPIDPEIIDEEKAVAITDLKVKLYNNLAHCQLQYNEYEAALDLCNRAIKYDPENVKALYRRSLAYTGLEMYVEAWADIQRVLQITPGEKAAVQQSRHLKPIIDRINEDYSSVVKKMFS